MEIKKKIITITISRSSCKEFKFVVVCKRKIEIREWHERPWRKN